MYMDGDGSAGGSAPVIAHGGQRRLSSSGDPSKMLAAAADQKAP